MRESNRKDKSIPAYDGISGERHPVFTTTYNIKYSFIC